MKYLLTLAVLFAGIHQVVQAQTLPVGILDHVEEAYRQQQLIGQDSLKRSFMIRPLSLVEGGSGAFAREVYADDALRFRFMVLPVALQQQITKTPYSRNDGAMIPAVGYQASVSAGFYAAIGPLSVQVRPEYVYAENKHFRSILETTNGEDLIHAYQLFNRSIDLPERFGEGRYRKVNLGQSSVRLNHGPLSLGYSNESLWWGPGQYNALLMSNNAAGFQHFTLNTVRPVQSPIGSFEGQLIKGTLKNSGIALDERLNLDPKPTGDRDLMGLVLSYQPRWVAGLYVGFDLTAVKNKEEVDPASPSALIAPYYLNKGESKDKYHSFFARWVMPESRSEFYVQYGRKKFNYELEGDALEDHTRAYVAGFTKLVALGGADQYLKVGLEVTQTENKNERLLSPWPGWYNHYVVTDGYTHQGQLLGAAVGPGGNMQTLDVAWVKGLKRLGIQVERQVHNNDLFYTARPYTADMRRNWVDLSLSGKFDWDFKNLVLNSQIAYLRSLNNQWTFERPPSYGGKDFWDWDKQDVNRLQLRLGMMYRF